MIDCQFTSLVHISLRSIVMLPSHLSCDYFQIGFPKPSSCLCYMPIPLYLPLYIKLVCECEYICLFINLSQPSTHKFTSWNHHLQNLQYVTVYCARWTVNYELLNHSFLRFPRNLSGRNTSQSTSSSDMFSLMFLSQSMRSHLMTTWKK
jgi:hypothetical protein